VPDSSLWRSSARICIPYHRPVARRGSHCTAARNLRSALLHELLRDRHGELQACRSVVGAQDPRCTLFALAGAGSGGRATLSVLRRTEENSAARSRAILPLRPRRRGRPVQPPADRRGAHQRALTSGLASSRRPDSLPHEYAGEVESAAVAASNIYNTRTSDAAVALDDVVVAFPLADGGVYTAVERA